MRNVVVTGGSRGLGLAMTTQLLGAGYRVIAVARSDSDGLAALRATHGERVVLQPGDLADTAGLAALARLLRAHGPIYGLVNNAGIGTPGILATMPDGQIERLIQLNVTSPILLTKYVTRGMLAARSGRVINIASIVATTGFSGLSAYAASKAALIGFTRSLARELGAVGVTVNAVAPGFVATEMTHALSDDDRARIARRSALRRLADAADVAAAVGFLLSDAGSNITGTVLTVDAGSTA